LFRAAPAAVRWLRSKQKEIYMRHLIKFALLAGAALAVSGCNRGAPAANNMAGEVVDNGALEMPGNDASAVESITNAPLPPPPAVILGDDDRVHLRWLFARDRRQAGPATATVESRRLPVAQVTRLFIAAGDSPRETASRRAAARSRPTRDTPLPASRYR
jgi:hypothetical protein